MSLALSLHAPSQELRQQIVPSARAYPLHKLMAAVDEYQTATGQKVFIEYVMLAGKSAVQDVVCKLFSFLWPSPFPRHPHPLDPPPLPPNVGTYDL